MTVSMGIEHSDDGKYDVVPIATSEIFRLCWLPACKGLGLELVSHFHDGALTEVRPEEVSLIVEELQTLREWASSQIDRTFMVERIDKILRAFRETDFTECIYDFG